MQTVRLDWLEDGRATHGVDFVITDDDLALTNDQLIERIFTPAIRQSLEQERRQRGMPTEAEARIAELQRLIVNA